MKLRSARGLPLGPTLALRPEHDHMARHDVRRPFSRAIAPGTRFSGFHLYGSPTSNKRQVWRQTRHCTETGTWLRRCSEDGVPFVKEKAQLSAGHHLPGRSRFDRNATLHLKSWPSGPI
jgi:hypothetical protein